MSPTRNVPLSLQASCVTVKRLPSVTAGVLCHRHETSFCHCRHPVSPTRNFPLSLQVSCVTDKKLPSVTAGALYCPVRVAKFVNFAELISCIPTQNVILSVQSEVRAHISAATFHRIESICAVGIFKLLNQNIYIF